MFTVLIAEKVHIDAIQRENRLFFEPFLESKELAFCEWNPAGQNLQDSVPGLLDAVGRRKNWRAVIINDCSIQPSPKRNPFDVVDCSALHTLAAPDRQPREGETMEAWENSWRVYYDALTDEKTRVYKSALEHPFQKLTTWLCFKQEDYVLNDVKEKQDIHDWAMEKIGRDSQKASVRLEGLEREQYKRELRIKENLRREFLAESYLKIAYPSEVYCISLRAAENNYFDPDAYWSIRQDNEYSEFADRNMYFDRMRFLVFDLLSPSHRNFRTDYIRFLATVLIFISNSVPGSAMRARRLYQLETETDDAPLCTLVTSYDKKLLATYEVIENEMEKIRSEIPGVLTDKDAEALFCTPMDVTVLLDGTCDAEKVFVDKDYGLFFDRPENEFHKWNRDYKVSEKELVYIAKQQSRSVRKSVGQMRQLSEVSDVNISRLTPLQINDIREYTDAAEDKMIASIPADLTDHGHYVKQMSQEAEKVQKVIGSRMSQKTATALIAIFIGLFFVCFLPFLLANHGTSRSVMAAIIVSLGMCGILAVVMVITLFVLRSTVRGAVRSYNQTVQQIVDEIQASMKQFSEYLSASCNVRRGNAVQNYAKNHVDMYTRSLRIRIKHQEDIRKKRAMLAEKYGDYFGDRSNCDKTMCNPYEYDFDETTEYAYPAPFLAGDCRQIEFISNGNLVTVPSSFITRISVRMEGIYE